MTMLRESNFYCPNGDEHIWPAELDDGVCEQCRLPYDEWSEDATHDEDAEVTLGP